METIDILWVTLCSALVFMMQVGFLCLETGFTRSKNNVNVAVKNLVDFCVSTLVFWGIGFGLMFGASYGGWFGVSNFFVNFTGANWSFTTFFVFQVMFCGAAVTIISGAVAERMKFSSYILITVLISGLVYPVAGHWSWATLFGGETNGFLADLGFYDFAGSTVVHSVGGWGALAAVLIIGPRLGRFDQTRLVSAFQPSSMPLAAVGTMFLFIGWLGFNGGSTLAWNDQVGFILVNTILAATAGAVSSGALAFGVTNRLDAGQFMNGCLGGLVAITAGANLFSSPLAILIGMVGGMVVVATEEILNHFKIDDAVGAIPVHLGAGIWGTLAVGLYGDLEMIGTGLSRFSQIGVQLLGIGVYAVWTFGVTFSVLLLVKQAHNLRVSKEDEEMGLNISEHGISQEMDTTVMAMTNEKST
jgi:Amt family ammonium transporter